LGDAGVMSGAALDAMTLSTTQVVTGAKTFQSAKLVATDPTLTGTVELDLAKLDFRRIRMWEDDPDVSGFGNDINVTSTLAGGGPVAVCIWPKAPSGLTNGATSTACYIFASEFPGSDAGDYDVLQIQAVKLSSTPGEGAARYDIVSFKNLAGYLHPIYMGIQGQNKLIFNTDGSINLNSLPLSNFRLSSAGTADMNGSVLNNVAGVRGVSTANSAYRGNPNATDATERSLIFQALDATTDTFLNVMTITPNGTTPRVTVDYAEDHKIITAPANPASGYVRAYPKTVDSNNEGFFVKQKVNGAVVEVQL
jgi:hypothetical protein